MVSTGVLALASLDLFKNGNISTSFAFKDGQKGHYSMGNGYFVFDMESEEPDVEHTFTDEQIQELIDWLESLTLVDIAVLKIAWESRVEQMLQ